MLVVVLLQCQGGSLLVILLDSKRRFKVLLVQEYRHSFFAYCLAIHVCARSFSESHTPSPLARKRQKPQMNSTKA
jgi:hypothetical protein